MGRGIVFVGNSGSPVVFEDRNKNKEESFTGSSGCLDISTRNLH